MENQEEVPRNPEEVYEFLVSSEELIDLPFSKSIEYLGVLIDLSLDLGRINGLEYARFWAESLSSQRLSSQERALLHYFRSNVWANFADIRRVSTSEQAAQDTEVAENKVWDWEQEELERQIFHLRAAIEEKSFNELSADRRCQIFTNLANLYSVVGRFVEAIEYWNRALSINPSFGMAMGNLGVGLSHYAFSLYDPGHNKLFFRKALSCLEEALRLPVHPNAKQSFESKRDELAAILPADEDSQEIDLAGFSIGDSETEIEYRQWCLRKGLFLNPLNDLGPYPIAARDVFTAPSIIYGLREAPHFHGLYNQLKQEFVSARYFFYEGVIADDVHFSDKGVLLYNTLDYPLYSLAAEKIKVAFRMGYSLFDKISFLLNAYLGLGIPERGINFRTIWYKKQKRKGGLKDVFVNSRNWPLRGLFWLSKDLFEDQEGFKNSTEPDARDLAEIRNQLEHKYLKLHVEHVVDRREIASDEGGADGYAMTFKDGLAFSLYHKDLESKTLRLLKMARAALMYLSLSIHREEYVRHLNADPNAINLGQNLDIWRDDWKHY